MKMVSATSVYGKLTSSEGIYEDFIEYEGLLDNKVYVSIDFLSMDIISAISVHGNLIIREICEEYQ